MNNYKQFISAVVYVRNNADTIAGFLLEINKVFAYNFERYEIICVNDNSVDTSFKIINDTAREHIEAPVTIINFATYHGQERAMTAGVDIAIGDFVYEFESCNIDYDSEEILNVYNTSITGYDIVSASKISKPSFMSRLFYKLLKTNNNLSDVSSESFRILSRRAINRINSLSDNILYRKAIYYNCGLNAKSIKYQPNKIVKFVGASFIYRQNLAVETLLTYSTIGYRISLFFSIFMMLFSLAVLIYSLVIFLVKSDVIEGWTTLMIFLSLSFFGISFLFTILIKYASLILSRLNSKKEFIYESVTKVNKG